MEPGALTLRVTELALMACRQGKRGMLVRALTELMTGLDLAQGEVAGRLLVLYEYMLHQARVGALAELEPLLAELAETWRQAWRAEVEARGTRTESCRT